MSNDTLKSKSLAFTGQLDVLTDELRLIPVMSNSTAPTELDAEFVADLTSLDELTPAGRKTLAGKSVVEVPASNKIELRADDPVWLSMPDGARPIIGFALYKHVTDDTDSPFLAFLDGSQFPMNPGGQDFTLSFPGGVVWTLRPATF